MALAHFRMLIHELLNKDPDIVPEESPLIILDIKSDVCMDNNVKDNKHKRHIFRRVHYVSNGEKRIMHHIDWCEGSLKSVDNATNNVRENYLNSRMKYILVRLDR